MEDGGPSFAVSAFFAVESSGNVADVAFCVADMLPTKVLGFRDVTNVADF